MEGERQTRHGSYVGMKETQVEADLAPDMEPGQGVWEADMTWPCSGFSHTKCTRLCARAVWTHGRPHD